MLRYDQTVATARTAEALAQGFADGLVATLRDEAFMHRLWYDLRSQALFEESFRADVLAIDESLERMIWRIVSRFGELGGTPLTVTSPVAYAMVDGLFQQALLRYLSGSENALPDLREHVVHLLSGLTQPASSQA